MLILIIIEVFFYIVLFCFHVEMSFVLTSTVQLNILDTLDFFKNSFVYMWLETWDTLHSPNARWLAYFDLHIFAKEFVEMLNY
jgi:hypothetical protein